MIERHRQAFASRDAQPLAAGHAPNGTFESQAAGVVRGRAAIQGVYEYWLKAFPDLGFTWREPIIDGDRVSLFWHFTGTLAGGDFFGPAQLGAHVEFSGAGGVLRVARRHRHRQARVRFHRRAGQRRCAESQTGAVVQARARLVIQSAATATARSTESAPSFRFTTSE